MYPLERKAKGGYSPRAMHYGSPEGIGFILRVVTIPTHIAMQYCIILSPTEKLSHLQNGVAAGVCLKYIVHRCQYFVLHMCISVFVHVRMLVGLEITTVVSWHLGSFNNMKIG